MIRFIDEFTDSAAWDAYVEAHGEGRFSQAWAYRGIERVYGYRPRYLGFERNGRIVGVLPAFEAKSLVFGRRLISQPFSEYGGFLIDRDLDDGARGEILAHVRRFVGGRGLTTLELHGNRGWGAPPDPFGRGNPQELATLDLGRSEDELWKKVVSRHVRKAVNKAEREGVTCDERSDAAVLKEDFYALYLQSMKRLGAPPHPLSYFTECLKGFGPRMRIFWALKDGARIAGLLGFVCGRRVAIVNIVSDSRYWAHRPNDLIHWRFVQWARGQGLERFDFGSVRYRGQEQYKEKWGCVMEESGYFFLHADAHAAIADGATFDSSGGFMHKASEIWAKAMPDVGARLLGPILRKHLMR